MGALRALRLYWPGEPFIHSDRQSEIARLLYEAGYTKVEMKEGNLSKKLRDPRPSLKWQTQVCEVLRLEAIGLDVKVLTDDDEESAFKKVKRQLQYEFTSIFEGNRNTEGLILLDSDHEDMRGAHGVRRTRVFRSRTRCYRPEFRSWSSVTAMPLK